MVGRAEKDHGNPDHSIIETIACMGYYFDCRQPGFHVESWDEISVVRSILMGWNPHYQRISKENEQREAIKRDN